MSKCPFLSTYQNKVICFTECPFYGCLETSELCPFKSVVKDKSIDTDIFYEYDLIKSERISFLDDLYESNQYFKILQL